MNKHNIKILTLDFSLKGGIERVVALLANSFSRNGYNVEIVSVFKSNDMESYATDEKVSIRYLTVKKYNCFNGVKKFIVFYHLIYNLIKYCLSDSFNKTIFISTLTNVSTVMCIAKIVNPKLKLIAAEHSQYYAHNKIIRIIRRLLFNKSNKVVVLTEHDKKIFENFLKPNKVCVIRNPVSFNINKASGLSFKRLISIGRLEDVKGYKNLIVDLSDFFKTNKEWTLDIYGDGSLKREINELIEKLGLTKNIYLRGFTRNIDKEICNSSFYLCSSLTEAFPMSFLEAFSVGLPVVSENCPIGPSEIISQHVNGVLLSEGGSFTIVLEQLIADEVLYKNMVNGCLSSVEAYKIDKITDEWIKVFSEINDD